MNFTREPIIETIITPKDGYKLVVRNSKASDGEEYAVDAVEVVSFGNALFFRSSERPKPFLVPVTDFEVVEAKETRVVLKNASFERAIKIGGGKEGSMKASKEKEEEPKQVEQRLEKNRERRRHRRRRGSLQTEEEATQASSPEPTTKGGAAEDETPVSSSAVSRLIPPPPGLISDKITQPSQEALEAAEGAALSKPVEEESKKEEKAKRVRRRKKTEPKGDLPTSDEAKPKEVNEENTKALAQPEEEMSKETKVESSKADTSNSQEPPQRKEGGDLNRVSVEEQDTVMSPSFSTLDAPSGELFGKIW